LGVLIAARSKRDLFDLEIALAHGSQGQPHCSSVEPRFCLRGAGINTKLDLSKTLPRRLEGSFSPYLADVAENLAALLRADPVLHDPALGVAAQANPETRQVVVPFDVIVVLSRSDQGGHASIR